MKKINLFTSSEYYQQKKRLSVILVRWSSVITVSSFLLVFVILIWEWQVNQVFEERSTSVRNLRQLVKGDEDIENKYNQLASLYEYYKTISQKSYPWSENLNSLLFFSADAKIEAISLDASSAFQVRLASANQQDLKKLSDRLETLGTDQDGVKRLVLTEGKIVSASSSATLTIRGLLNLKK